MPGLRHERPGSLPDGLRAGEPWRVDVTVLAHGRTPAVGLEPRLVLTGPERRTGTVAARPTAPASPRDA